MNCKPGAVWTEQNLGFPRRLNRVEPAKGLGGEWTLLSRLPVEL